MLCRGRKLKSTLYYNRASIFRTEVLLSAVDVNNFLEMDCTEKLAAVPNPFWYSWRQHHARVKKFSFGDCIRDSRNAMEGR